jgi:GNAT superfamily N-acetyltransferase
MTIRRLTPADVEAYRQVRMEALRTSPSAFCSSVEEEQLQPIEFFMRRLEDNHVFGALTDDARLVGIAGIVREDRRKRAHQANVVGMFVAADFRRQGIGGALLDRVIACAREMDGVEALKLSVMSAQDDARSLYEARGFTAYGVEPRAIRVEGRDYDEVYLILPLC